MNERELLERCLLEARLSYKKIKFSSWGDTAWIKRQGDRYIDDSGVIRTWSQWEYLCGINFGYWELYVEPVKEYTFMEAVQIPGKYKLISGKIYCTMLVNIQLSISFEEPHVKWLHPLRFAPDARYIKI